MKNIFFIATLVSHFLFAFEDVQILTIDGQIALYKEIYSAYNHAQFDPRTTHITRYNLILPMAFSYTQSLLREHGHLPAARERLEQFWLESQEDMAQQRMTIARYKKTVMRLSLLVSEEQTRGAFYYASGLLRTIQDRFQKGEYTIDYNANDFNGGFITKPNILESHHYPFCFEALIFCKKGEFSLDDYLSSLLDTECTISLSVFPLSGEGPHNNFLKDSAGFLFHDLTHWALLVDSLGRHPENWPQIKQVCRQFYQEKTQLKDRTLLFLLIHELPQNIERLDEEIVEHSEKIASLFPRGNLAPESWRIFSRWFYSAHSYLGRALDFVSPRENQEPNVFIIKDVMFIRDVGESTYSLFLNSDQKLWHSGVSYNLTVGFEPHDYGSWVRIKIGNIVRTCNDSINDGAKLAKEELDQLIDQSLQNYQESFLSEKFFYDALFYDLRMLLNQAFDRERLTIDSLPIEFIDAWKELAIEFLATKSE